MWKLEENILTGFHDSSLTPLIGLPNAGRKFLQASKPNKSNARLAKSLQG